MIVNCGGCLHITILFYFIFNHGAHFGPKLPMTSGWLVVDHCHAPTPTVAGSVSLDGHALV